MAKKKDKPKKPQKLPTPKQRKPWDIPPPALGDKTKEEVYVSIGYALSKWESLESCLARIFGALVGQEGDSLPAERAYGSVLTFRGRKEMIEAAAEAFFFIAPHDALHEKIKNLLKESANFAARRNEIAHGKVTTKTTETLFPKLRHYGHVLGPPNYATNKTELKESKMLLLPVHHEPSYAYSSNEINAFADHFERLAEEGSRLPLQLLRHYWAHMEAKQEKEKP